MGLFSDKNWLELIWASYGEFVVFYRLKKRQNCRSGLTRFIQKHKFDPFFKPSLKFGPKWKYELLHQHPEIHLVPHHHHLGQAVLHAVHLHVLMWYYFDPFPQNRWTGKAMGNNTAQDLIISWASAPLACFLYFWDHYNPKDNAHRRDSQTFNRVEMYLDSLVRDILAGTNPYSCVQSLGNTTWFQCGSKK